MSTLCHYCLYQFLLILAGPFELCSTKISDPASFFLSIIQAAEGRGCGHYY